MDDPRYYFEITNLLEEFNFMRSILLQSIRLAEELKNENPRDLQLQQSEEELRQLLGTLETDFVNRLQSIQNNSISVRIAKIK